MLGAVTDIVKIGGKFYSVDQLIDKVVTANVATKIYTRPGGTLKGTIASNQPIGKVISYLRPSQTPDGRTWLQFENAYLDYFFVPDEAVSPQALKDQNVLTLEEQVKQEAEEKLKQESPLEYYISKYAGKVLLTAAVVWGAVELGKTFIKQKVK